MNNALRQVASPPRSLGPISVLGELVHVVDGRADGAVGRLDLSGECETVTPGSDVSLWIELASQLHSSAVDDGPPKSNMFLISNGENVAQLVASRDVVVEPDCVDEGFDLLQNPLIVVEAECPGYAIVLVDDVGARIACFLGPRVRAVCAREGVDCEVVAVAVDGFTLGSWRSCQVVRELVRLLH